MHEEKRSIVVEVCSIIAHASDPNKTLQAVTRLFLERLNANICLICLKEGPEGKLAIKASSGLFLEELQQFSPTAGVSYQTCEKCRPINLPSLSSGQAGCAFPESLKKRVNSMLALPLIAGGKPIGSITIGRHSRQAFPQPTIKCCEAAAVPLAAFLVSASLSRQVQENDASRKKENEPAAVPGSPQADPLSREVLRGKPIVGGVSRGHALILSSADALTQTPLQSAENLEAELELLQKSYAAARESMRKITRDIGEILTEADAAIFEMYSVLLEDPTLYQRIADKISMSGYNLESALSLTLKELTAEYQAIEDEYLRERLCDIKDVLLRLKNAATNIRQPGHPDDEESKTADTSHSLRLILVAKELLPTQLVASPLKQVAGIICESGGPTSHAAILARALSIPMLVGIDDIQNKVAPGDNILIDCASGLCFLHPTRQLLRQYRQPLAHFRNLQNATRSDSEQEPRADPVTLDGTPVHLMGNITLFSELAALHSVGVFDIGLYRTEFMFMIRNAMPDEDEQVRVLSRLIEASRGADVTIRALDIGGDKPLSYIDWGHEENPSLGWRGLRFLLSNPEFLHTHLRAILRTSAHGQVNLLVPMVADKFDLLEAKAAYQKARDSLRADGLPFSETIRFGIMLELPSAVCALDTLLPEVDFVSIGTNDLIQYLFGVDRGNTRVNRWYRQCHPTVFRIIEQICRQTALHPDKTVSLCGELAGNAKALPALLGAGLRHFSMNANALPHIRAYAEKLHLGECAELYAQACRCDSDRDVQNLLDAFAKKKNFEPVR